MGCTALIDRRMAFWPLLNAAHPVNDGLLRTSYKELSGVTVEDFSTRIREIFRGTTTATFCIARRQRRGIFSSVSFDVSPDPLPLDTLPQATDISGTPDKYLHKKWGLKLTRRKIENTKTDEEGRPIILPWNEYELMIQTSTPPSILSLTFMNLPFASSMQE